MKNLEIAIGKKKNEAIVPKEADFYTGIAKIYH